MKTDLADMAETSSIAIEPREFGRDLGLTAYKQRRLAGEVPLTPRHRLLAEYLVHGTNHARAQRLGLPLNTPLSLSDAARVVDMKLRNARQVFATPQFKALHARLLADMRSGETARSIAAMATIRDDPGENTAADRTARLKAAQALLNEGGVSIAIDNRTQTHIGIQVRPGYVFERSSSSLARPTIEATVVRPALDFGPYEPPPETLQQNRERLIVAPPSQPAIGEGLDEPAAPSAFEELAKWK
jgi:hypothetical protein